jgi:xylulose-5-phosphate/fructose-6-phosphate phosphoketolase
VSVAETLTSTELQLMDAYWRAANYLSVGQIYLLDNPLLEVPLQAEHVKPRLLVISGRLLALTSSTPT